MFLQYLCATTGTNTASQPALGCGDQRDRRWASSFGEIQGRGSARPAVGEFIWRDTGVKRQLRAVYATKNNTEIYLLLSNATQLSYAPLGVWPCFKYLTCCFGKIKLFYTFLFLKDSTKLLFNYEYRLVTLFLKEIYEFLFIIYNFDKCHYQ